MIEAPAEKALHAVDGALSRYALYVVRGTLRADVGGEDFGHGETPRPAERLKDAPRAARTAPGPWPTTLTDEERVRMGKNKVTPKRRTKHPMMLALSKARALAWVLDPVHPQAGAGQCQRHRDAAPVQGDRAGGCLAEPARLDRFLTT
jgi:hypothetical protein